MILRSKLRFLLKNTGVDSDFTQNFWGKNWWLKSLADFNQLRISEFFRFIEQTFGRLSENGKMGRINQIWGWKWVFLHLEGWKTTMYYIYTLILQCSYHEIGFNWRYMHFLKFNVCSKRILLLWIKICRDFTLQTQIFTQIQ